MPRRVLRFSFRKNAIYDRRGASRALSDLWWRGDSGSPCTGDGEFFCGGPRRKNISRELEDIVYLYRDLYMPQRAD